MNQIKNKIITISGEPASGKSTVVKHLKSKYEKMGFNVHIISVGHTFRDLAKKEYLKMYPDRTDANLADIQTDPSFIAKRDMIDKMVDGEVAKRGNEINSVERPNDVYIIDSRLAWSNVPESYAVRLMVNENIAGDRVFKDKTRGKEDQYDSVEEAITKTRERKLAEISRYKQRYGVDLTNPDNYDLIVDTSYSKSDELADIIIEGEEKYRSGEYYPKTWKSPALFLPSQRIAETLTTSPLGSSIEDINQSIKENGYAPNGEVLAVEKNGVSILRDGHHRAIAALLAGKTLIPYFVKNKDDEFAEKYVNGEVRLSNIYDWEDCIRYYAKKGNIESLKDFNIRDVIDIDKVIPKRPIPVGDGR